jgi:methylenetetrahydrofolate reductase (NADPH)
MTPSPFPFELSFEFFPPKTEVGTEKLKEAWEELNKLHPKYYSVTFGAGGSTQEKTAETIHTLIQHGMDAAPHLSCIGMKKNTILELLHLYQQYGVKRLVALRGDFPPNVEINSGDFNHACDLVEFIREQTDDHFHIEVGAYPEFHPKAIHALSDMEYFKRKIDAGANGAITQYFFNIEAYEQFLELCAKIQIKVPITPGIMPIASLEKLIRFSAVCGAEVPMWLHKRLAAYGDDQESATKLGIEVVATLCKKLLALGAPGLHFYTLNQVNPTREILQLLN